MANYLVTDTELSSVADAIREKGGTTADLEFPSEFISAIAAISGGGEFTKIGTISIGEVSASSGTSSELIGSFDLPLSTLLESPLIVLVVITNTAPELNGFLDGVNTVGFQSGSLSSIGRLQHGGDSGSVFTTSSYGVYVNSATFDAKKMTLQFFKRTATTGGNALGSVAGTYKADVYLMG